MNILWLDFETMGDDILECAAIDLSVIVGNTDKMISDTPYTTSDLELTRKFKLSVTDQVKTYGFTVQESSMKFWSTVSPEARSRIKPTPTDLTVKEFINQFILYLIEIGKIDYWFTRGNTFDPIMLQRLFKTQHLNATFKEYLKFHRVQDMRTHLNAKLNYPVTTNLCPIKDEAYWKEVFVEHDSRWDVLADLLRYQAVIRAENDLEMINR